MRVALAGMWHETNTFSLAPTTLGDFQAYQYFSGHDLLDGLAGTGTELGGALDAARELGVLPVPLTFAAALPSGTVTEGTFNHIVGAIVRQARDQLPLEGVVLALHGAMVVQGRADPEADIVQAVRTVVGDVPIAVTLDFHANVSSRLARVADVICGYRTYPHVDMSQRGADAMAAVVRAARRGVRPETCLVKLPLLTIPMAQESALQPMSSILALVEAAVGEAEVWSACALPGFPYSQGDRLGFSVYVASDRHPGPMASDIAAEVWRRRNDFAPTLIDVDRAVRLARGEPTPCVVVDVADNVGGGSPGDSSHVLHALRRNGAVGSVTVMWDPALVSQVHAGMPSGASHWVGGRSDPSMGPPFELRSTPKCHGHVTYLRRGTYMSGSRVDMGRVAVFHEDVGDVVVTENRVVPFDDDHLRVLGIEPQLARILVAKGAIAWKAAFGDYARRIHYISGPGTCPVDVTALPFATRPVPIYPLETDTTWAALDYSSGKD